MLRTLSRLPKGAADWLSLAAAPTFAAMALVTAAGGAGPLDMLCAGASPLGGMFLSGMVPMYVLDDRLPCGAVVEGVVRALPAEPAVQPV